MAAPHSQANFRGLNSLATSHPPSQPSGESRFAENASCACPTALALTLQAGVTEAGAHASPSLAIHRTNNTYTAAPSGYADSAPPADANNWLPEENFATGLGFQANAYPADVDSWQQLPPQSLPEQQQTAFAYPEPSPPPRNPLTPTIRVTTDFSNLAGFQQQPQDIYHSATSVSSNSSIPQLPEAYYHNPYAPHAQHLSPQGAHFPMHQEQQEMQTPPHSPRHPHSPQNGPGGEQISRKRSHSLMSEGHQTRPHSAGSRSGSIASAAAQSPGEEYSPRNRAFKRPDPPMNTDNKYYCDFSEECSGSTFDRKCEWR